MATARRSRGANCRGASTKARAKPTHGDEHVSLPQPRCPYSWTARKTVRETTSRSMTTTIALTNDRAGGKSLLAWLRSSRDRRVPGDGFGISPGRLGPMNSAAARTIGNLPLLRHDVSKYKTSTRCSSVTAFGRRRTSLLPSVPRRSARERQGVFEVILDIYTIHPGDFRACLEATSWEP
jgi:hypothetical protein